jgi:hypothetical protein
MAKLTVLLSFLCVSLKLKRTQRRWKRGGEGGEGGEREREREREEKIMYEKLVRDSGIGSNNTSKEDETVEMNVKKVCDN